MRRVIAFCIALAPASASAAVINVPADHATIQAAINASVNGDEIIVAPGTYNESINPQGKAITIRSADPTDPAVVQATIIDPLGVNAGVICVSGETANTVFSGFTITGGSALTGGGSLTLYDRVLVPLTTIPDANAPHYLHLIVADPVDVNPTNNTQTIPIQIVP